MEPSTFEREMKKFDSKLRLRKAKLGSWFFIERKARRGSVAVPTPKEGVSIDRYVRDTEGYVLITRCRRGDLNKHTLFQLRASDMWEKRHGRFGAEGVAYDEQIRQEEAEKRQERVDSEKIQEHSSEVYDKQMSRQGDVVYPGLPGNVKGNKK